MSMNEKLRSLANEIGSWSLSNFGNQMSRQLKTSLRSTAPCLGIGEEIGELAEAENETDVRDAAGDVGVYLCDFAQREQGVTIAIYDLSDLPESQTQLDPFIGLVAANGMICHAVLKRHQGIRGYDQTDRFRKDCELGLKLAWFYLDAFCNEQLGESALEVTEAVFRNVVGSRDWNADKEAGTSAESTPDPSESTPDVEVAGNVEVFDEEPTT